MELFRRDKSLPSDDFSDPICYWSSVRSSLREKSDHNKIEAQALFFFSILFSVSAPLFIAFGRDEIWGKVVPAALSAIVALITSWLQLRKPQKLWALYRRAQRQLEHEKVLFDNSIGKYEGAVDSKKLLAESTANIALAVHEQWESLVPDSAVSTASTDSETQNDK
jgi:hypothetical protein